MKERKKERQGFQNLRHKTCQIIQAIRHPANIVATLALLASSLNIMTD